MAMLDWCADCDRMRADVVFSYAFNAQLCQACYSRRMDARPHAPAPAPAPVTPEAGPSHVGTPSDRASWTLAMAIAVAGLVIAALHVLA